MESGPLGSDEYYHGWNAAFDNDCFYEGGSADWRRGYRDARQHQDADEKDLRK